MAAERTRVQMRKRRRLTVGLISAAVATTVGTTLAAHRARDQLISNAMAL